MKKTYLANLPYIFPPESPWRIKQLNKCNVEGIYARSGILVEILVFCRNFVLNCLCVNLQVMK